MPIEQSRVWLNHQIVMVLVLGHCLIHVELRNSAVFLGFPGGVQ